MGYNSWLREQALESKDTLSKNMDRLLAQLSVLDSVICQAEISTDRFVRVSLAMVHLMTEIHLLVTTMEEK